MGKKRMLKEERETILATTEADTTWNIYTYNTDLKKRLKNFTSQYPELCVLIREDREYGSVEFVIEKSRVSIRLIPPYSEARRKAASEHAKEHGFGVKDNENNTHRCEKQGIPHIKRDAILPYGQKESSIAIS